MAKPLDLAALGIDGARNPVDVKTTERLILPFTRGESPLIVGPGGAVAAESTPEAMALIRATPADADFYSSIGRNFRTFTKWGAYGSPNPLLRGKSASRPPPPGDPG